MTDLKFTPPETFPANYITRDGRKVELLRRINRDYGYAFAGILTNGADSASAEIWTETGSLVTTRYPAADLQDIPQRREVWVNVYPDGGPNITHRTMERAYFDATEGRIALWRIRYDEDGGNPEITVEWQKGADE